MSIVKLILKILIYIIVLALLPFIAEWMVNFYDSQYNPMTRPNAIITSSKGVHEGSNQRLFNEIRFRSEGMSVRLRCSELTEVEASSIANRITGVFTVRTEEEYKNNKPGQSFNFKLVQNIAKPLNRVQTRYEVDNVNLTTNFEVECDIKPISFTDEAIERELLAREFEKGEKVYFDINLSGRVPPKTDFVFTYSRSPRSVLRGTRLYNLEDKLLSALGF